MILKRVQIGSEIRSVDGPSMMGLDGFDPDWPDLTFVLGPLENHTEKEFTFFVFIWPGYDDTLLFLFDL